MESHQFVRVATSALDQKSSDADVQKLYKKLVSRRLFRLLQLQNGPRDAPLRGTLLQEADLNATGAYEAISYRWSAVDPIHPASIDIDGVRFPIGPNLHDALVQFRQEVVPRFLWIDQICINQKDTKEKIQQIQQMGDIYSRASKVLVWLGNASDQSDMAMDFFPTLVERVRQDNERRRLHSSSEPPTGIIEWRGSLATCLNKLFSRTWFGRVWTLQEAARGKDVEVWCGQKSFPFSALETFQRGCDNDDYGHWGQALFLIESGCPGSDPENPNRPSISHIQIISSLKRKERTGSVSILNSLRMLDCSEDQDRIYSVLGFLGSELAKEIVGVHEPTTAELYRLVAVHELKRGEYEFLGAAGLSQHRGHTPSQSRISLPSWVPDWTYKIRTHSYWVHNRDCLRKRGRPIFVAGGSPSESHSWTFSHDGKLLYAPGIIIDEVEQCANPFRFQGVPADLSGRNAGVNTVGSSIQTFESYIASCMDLAAKCTRNYGSTNIRQACRRSLVGGMMPEGSTTLKTGVTVRANDDVVDSLFNNFESHVQILRLLCGMPSNDAALTDGDSLKGIFASTPSAMDQMPKIRQSKDPLSGDNKSRVANATDGVPNIAHISKKNNLMQAMAEACKGRRFFITSDDRYMGMAPDITEPGCKICIIPGCCAPFVIRPKGDHYELIGECYVAGVMDGEIMEKEGSSVDTIVLE